MRVLAFPDSARVVLRARNNRIPLIVERATENLIGVPFQHLQAVPAVHLPQPRRLITARRQYLGALRVEANLGDLPFVPNQNRLARSSLGVVNTRCAIGRRRHKL